MLELGGVSAPISTFENFLDIEVIHVPLLLKFIGEQDFGKILRQGYHSLPWQLHFQRHVYSNFDFLIFFSIN